MLATGLASHLPKPLVSAIRAAKRLASFPRSGASPSFSQCGEDLILSFAFHWLGIARPTYLDVGAHHPTSLSNTALFYSRGSSGVNIEPNNQLFEKIKRARKRDVNLNVGVADAEGQLDFYVMSAPELSTFNKGDAERIEREGGPRITSVRAVKVRLLNSILADYFPDRPPDLLSLDVEGLDLSILRSLDFHRHRPLAICVETIEYCQTGIPRKNAEILAYLQDLGYIVFADTFVNTIFFHQQRFEEYVRTLKAN